MRPEQWLQLAGFGTWAAATIPAVAALLDGRLTGGRWLAWGLASLAFLIAFSGICWSPLVRRRRIVAVGLLLLQSVCALIMVGSGHDSVVAAALLVVVAGELLPLFDTARAAAWIIAQTLALMAVFGSFGNLLPAVTYGSAFGGFQFFALGSAALVERERRAREALARVNVELQATRALMVEHERVAERLRIARDLHDTVGHHLTALSLQLEVASRLTDGKATEHVTQAHALARLLLADVRDVVGQLRESSRFDLVRAVRALADQSCGDLHIHLDAPSVISIDDDAQAQTILRCLQEIVTNARRHAKAHNLWLTITSDAVGIAVHGRDDGRGAAMVSYGHGLTGMRERFEALSGRLELTTTIGGGFEVHGSMPRVQAVS